MRRNLIIVVGALLAVRALAAGPRCGSERWPVKTLTDPGVLEVRLDQAVIRTVEQMRQLMAPRYDDANPRALAERTVFSVRARIMAFKLEADQDIHVVIAGDSGQTMIAELPDPRCAAGSRVAEQLSSVRAAFIRMFGRPTPRMRRLRTPVRVTITGVGFFDKIHGQAGVAPNGVELHPVLSLGVRP